MDSTQITNKLLIDMVKNQKESNRSLKEALIWVILGFTTIIITLIIGFVVYESQYETTEQTQFSVDQEASGDDAEINNVLGNMYKDNATHNEGE